MSSPFDGPDTGKVPVFPVYAKAMGPIAPTSSYRSFLTLVPPIVLYVYFVRIAGVSFCGFVAEKIPKIIDFEPE
jgi:hypothetical protein